MLNTREAIRDPALLKRFQVETARLGVSIGVVLRLVHAVFCVRSTVREVEAIGTYARGDDVGEVLRLRVTRERFAAADLEEPNLALLLHELGGVMRVSSELEMAPIPLAS